MGTTVPTSPSLVCFLRAMWLPLWCAIKKPNLLQRILRHSLPEIFLSNDKSLNLKSLQHRFRKMLFRKLFQIQLRCFFEVFKSFFNRRTLTYCSYFRTGSYIEVLFFLDNCSKFCHMHNQ